MKPIIPEVMDLAELARIMDWGSPEKGQSPDPGRSLDEWNMERDDAPMLRYIYQSAKPSRHLEFGTWEGFGAALCLLESSATVWSINLPEGQETEAGPAYGSNPARRFSARMWSEAIGSRTVPDQTDSLGFVGRLVLERGLGHRFFQSYCDSRDWDDRGFPDGFFDTIFVDGAHDSATVASDALKALRLVRPQGLVIWHDYCPPVRDKFFVVDGVISGLESIAEQLSGAFERLIWIRPSWMLIGIRNSHPGSSSPSQEKNIVYHDSRALSHVMTMGDDPAHRLLRLVLSTPDLATTLRNLTADTPDDFDRLIDKLASARSLPYPDQILLQRIRTIREALTESRSGNPHIREDFLGTAIAGWLPSPGDVSAVSTIAEICDCPALFSSAQIIQIAAFIRAFRADLVIEVGREIGLSTAALAWGLKVADTQGRLVSYSATLSPQFPDIFRRIQSDVLGNEGSPSELLEFGIEEAQFDPVSASQRTIVFWNDPRPAAVEAVLSRLLPKIHLSPHCVILHGISDGRTGHLSGYSAATQGLLMLGDVWSYHAHLPILVDFATRNRIPLLSADYSLAAGIETDPALIADRVTAWNSQLSVQAHWRWFSLNGRADACHFPPPSSGQPRISHVLPAAKPGTKDESNTGRADPPRPPNDNEGTRQPVPSNPRLTPSESGHHPIFERFPVHEVALKPGHVVDYLGSVTRMAHLQHMPYAISTNRVPPLPPVDEDYFEWIDLLESVAHAKSSFTMLELGAGFGRWSTRAYHAARRHGCSDVRLSLVEPEPLHVAWIPEHMADNGIPPTAYEIYDTAIGSPESKRWFYVARPASPSGNVPEKWYGQRVTDDKLEFRIRWTFGRRNRDPAIAGLERLIPAEYREYYKGRNFAELGGGWESGLLAMQVKQTPLSTIICDYPYIDFLDADVQGAEMHIFHEAMSELCARVARVHIGTHSGPAEEQLRALFTAADWKAAWDFGCAQTAATPFGQVSFVDGVQFWINPRFAK